MVFFQKYELNLKKYESELKTLANTIKTNPVTEFVNNRGRKLSYATETEIYLNDEGIDAAEKLEDKKEFYSDLFYELDLFDSCCRLDINGEYIIMPDNLQEFKVLEHLTLPFPRLPGQFSSNFLPDTLIHFDSHKNDRGEADDYLSNLNSCKNLQNLMINVSQIGNNILDDLPKLRFVFIAGKKGEKLKEQFLQRIMYRIIDHNHPRFIEYHTN
jgi:hypothetical protein